MVQQFLFFYNRKPRQPDSESPNVTSYILACMRVIQTIIYLFPLRMICYHPAASKENIGRKLFFRTNTTTIVFFIVRKSLATSRMVFLCTKNLVVAKFLVHKNTFSLEHKLVFLAARARLLFRCTAQFSYKESIEIISDC